MHILNASIEPVSSGYAGVRYYLQPNEAVKVSPETGAWILNDAGKLGLVRVDDATDRKNLKAHIARRMLEGLQAYAETLLGRLEGYQSLDQEVKSVNGSGTVLNTNSCRREQERLRQTNELIAELEAKHGISIAKANLEHRSKDMLSTIEQLASDFEKDVERQAKASKEEVEANKAFEEALSAVTSRRK